MTERKQAIEMCLRFADVYEDYPFDDNWTAMRHKGNNKTFAFIYLHKGKIWLNLKALPEYGAVWRQQYDAVVPAYHMNKLHWISVVLDGTLSDETVLSLVTDSYNLTKPKQRSEIPF